MSHSTIRDFMDLPTSGERKRAWGILSAATGVAAIIVTIVAFGAPSADLGHTILYFAITILCTIAVFHARFLSLAQNQDREKNELLFNKEREFQSIFENALDAILVLDNEGICQNANASAGIFFSMRQDRIIGQPVHSFYADMHAFDSMWNQLQADRRYQGETELVRADGATVFAEFTAAAHFLPNRHLMILRDITRRRNAQQSAKQSLLVARSFWQEAEALRKASLALTDDVRMNNVLDALLQTLAQFVPFERAQLFLLEHGRLFLAQEAVSRTQPNPGPALAETLDISEFPIVERVLALREGLLIEDLRDEGRGRPLGKDSAARSWIGVPIVSAHEVLGLLSLTDSAPGAFSSSHLALTRSLATFAAVAVQNARLYERAEIYGTELERSITALRETDQAWQGSEGDYPEANRRFETIFRSAPVALSVSSLSNGNFLQTNEAFRRTFGFPGRALLTEIDLWEDHRERTKLMERLGGGARVRGAVARFRQKTGSYRETMYSAERIELDGQPCLLLVTNDQAGSGLGTYY